MGKIKIIFGAVLVFTLIHSTEVFAQDSNWITDQVSGCKFFNSNPQPNETIKFNGKCGSNRASGKLTWLENGEVNEVAEGQWLNGKQTGNGTYEYKKTGNIYKGSFIEGNMSGKGEFKWANGSSYIGDFKDDKRNGKGEFRWVNGDFYKGDFLDGKRHGKGEFQWPSGNTYVGDFFDNKRTGKGKFLWKDGSSYSGDFLDGKRNGKGVAILPNGTKYVGDFVAGKFHGNGEIIYAEQRYVGEFKDGKESGSGVVYFKDGAKLDANISQGEFVGRATYTLSNGQKVSGTWVKGEFEPDELNYDHATCVRIGFSPNSSDYVACRTQIEIAKKQAQEEQRVNQLRLAETQRQIAQERKEEALIRGLSALAGFGSFSSSNSSAANAPPPIHIYNLPGGRTMTCNTFGVFTNCN